MFSYFRTKLFVTNQISNHIIKDYEYIKFSTWVVLFNIFTVNNFLYCFFILLNLISYFLCIIFSFVSYAYVSIESTECIRLSSLSLNTIFLTSVVNAFFCFQMFPVILISIYCFFYEFFVIFSKIIYIKFIFFNSIFNSVFL